MTTPDYVLVDETEKPVYDKTDIPWMLLDAVKEVATCADAKAGNDAGKTLCGLLRWVLDAPPEPAPPVRSGGIVNALFGTPGRTKE